MEMKFVIWGAGERGKRVYKQLGEKYVLGFVDKDTTKTIDGLQTFSLKYYINFLSEYPIIISFAEPNDAIEQLKNNGIDNFFVLKNEPGPLQEPYQREFLKNYIKNYIIDGKKRMVVGQTLYAILIIIWGKEIGVDVKMYINSISSKKMIKFLKENDVSFSDGEGCDESLVCTYIHDESKRRILGKYFFDLDRDITQYHNRELEKYHNSKKGKSCFIVATGPSLCIKDLDMLKKLDIDSFSMNSIYKAYDSTTWRPTYFVAEDFGFLRNNLKDLENNSDITYFFGDCYHGVEQLASRLNYNMYHVNYVHHTQNITDFSEDVSVGVYGGGTVTYTCLQLAIYMGYKKIYLLGVDFSYADDKEKNAYGHFYKEEKKISHPATEWVLNSYIAAKQYADNNNIEIYNATRGGKLEVFKRVDVDTLFSDIKAINIQEM